MNEFTFENQGTSTLLVYQISPEETLDSMTLGMLTNNKIPGLATTIFTQIDQTKYLKYNVSSKISARQFFAGAVNKKRLIGVFSGIIEAMLSAEDYMIEPSSVLLDLDYIFADVSTCETVLICLPVVRDTEQVDLGTFFKTVMFSTQFDQTENCDHVAKIINYLNSAPVFSLTDFKSLLTELSGAAKKPEPMKAPAPKPQPAPKVQTPAASQQGRAEVLNQRAAPTPPPVQRSAETPPQPPVPPVVPPTPPKQEIPQPQQPAEPEEKMSFLYLMRHYSKENVEIYKNQGSGKQRDAGASKKDKKEKKEPKKDAPKHQQQVNFSVPGQKPSGFAVPGQPAPQPVPQAPQKPKQTVIQQPAVQPAVQPMPSAAASVLPQMPKQPDVVSGGKANFGETTVLGGGGARGETMVLNATNVTRQARPTLLRIKNNEKILVDKPVFRIGKERSYVDYFIGDNSAVSRSHANIVTKEGEYYIVDTNSTNHTYVNGEMIPSNVETKLTHGTRIRLGNEEFEFKIV